MYGSTFISGWCGYFKSGQTAPAGRILVFDEKNVYGFGRKPQYYRWTTPIEHQLFSAERISPGSDDPQSVQANVSVVRVAKSASLNPKKRPLTVAAWVKSENADGVVLARGWQFSGLRPLAKRRQAELRRPRRRRAYQHRSQTAHRRRVGPFGRRAHSREEDAALHRWKTGCFGRGEIVAHRRSRRGSRNRPRRRLIVGDYSGPCAFGGLIDEVRFYRSALNGEQIAQLMDGGNVDDGELAMAFSFDHGKANDSSGNGNHGELEGATTKPARSARPCCSQAKRTRQAISSNTVGHGICRYSPGQ